MKRNIIVITFLLFALTLNAAQSIPVSEKEKKPLLTVWAIGELVLPQDSRYKDLYGNTQINPKGQINLHLTSSFDLFAGFSLFSGNGQFDFLDLMIDMECKQSLLTFGVGYHKSLSPKMNWFVEAGGLMVFQKESAMNVTVSDSFFGFTVQGGMAMNIGKSLFARVHAGYSQAQKDVETDTGSLTVKPGGITLGAGLGFRF